ncbi:MAG: response regulator transcription factor [Actinomycetota bacterium]
MATAIGTSSIRRILVVEDEPAINDIVATALRYQGYQVTQTGNGLQAVSLAAAEEFDLVVLDVMLPGLDGYEVCRRLRDGGGFTPVIFLSAKDQTEDRVRGFVTGGDDYLTKPFSVDELVLRVAALLRRTAGPDDTPESDVVRVADLEISAAAHRVLRSGEPVELSPTEFRLLHYLVVNAGTVLSKGQILANVWDYEYDGNDTVVETYISYLRRKIDQGHPALIHTVRGVGYVVREK